MKGLFKPLWTVVSSQAWKWLASSLALSTLPLWAISANAEGSRSLTSGPGAAGRRPFLEYRNDLTGGIPRRTFIFVYAEAGETLDLGSSAHGVGAGGTIRYTTPNGLTTAECAAPTAANGLAGRIQTITQEQAGPLPNAGGYTPCVVPVTQSGIWRIEFISPNSASVADPVTIAATTPWTQAPTASWIAAWDVTVRSSGGTEIPGRAYATYLPLTIGRNVPNALTAQTFVLTIDGYLYEIRLNGLDPFAFIFFANNKGFRGANGNSLFRSVPLNPPANFQNPGALDTATDVTHKIFFNQPNQTLPANAVVPGGTTWLRRPALPPPTPTNFSFTGQEGTPNQAGTVPLTGSFRFDAPSAGGYSITIDINQNNVFGDANDRILLGTTTVGTNTVVWDGRDGNGVPVPASTIPFGAVINLNSGEVHFPLLDPENNPNGLIIQRLVPTGGNVFEVFYDDSALSGAGAPNPIRALSGINSSTGAHGFTNNFGDNRGIDTWVSVPSAPLRLASGITLAQADLAITKTANPNPAVPGSPITFTLAVTNNGPSNVTAARVLDTIPATIAGVNWSCAITAGTGSCGAANGSGNTIDTTVTLQAGATATYTITGTLSSTATGTITNTASVLRPNDVTDPTDVGRTGAGNNSSTSTTPISTSAPRIGVAKQAGTVVDNRDGTFTVPYTLRITNLGSIALQNLQVNDNLTSTFTGATAFQVTAPPSSSGLTVNSGFNGTSNTRLLTGTDTLPVGASTTIAFNVRVTPGSKLGPYNNTAIGTGIPQGSNTPVTDTSTDGLSVDPDNDGDPGNNSIPTPVSFSTTPRLRLVKRITAITRSGVPFTFANFVDDPNDPNDTVQGWAPFLPVGVLAIDASNPLRSGDEVEYTIYFLSDGGVPALAVNFCDAIASGSFFQPNSFGVDQGVIVNLAGTATVRTNPADADNVTVFSPLAPLPAANACSDQTNPNGSVTVNLGDIPNTPGNNYGFVRFRVKLD